MQGKARQGKAKTWEGLDIIRDDPQPLDQSQLPERIVTDLLLVAFFKMSTRKGGFQFEGSLACSVEWLALLSCSYTIVDEEATMTA